MGLVNRVVGSGGRYRHLGKLHPPRGFDHLICASIGADGLPIALWAKDSDRSDLLGSYQGPGGATFPETRTSSRPSVAITRHDARQPRPSSTVVVDGLPVAHPLVQPLPDGQVVVGVRCAWRDEGPEHNALLLAADGSIERTGTVGDGVEHLVVDAEGGIWTGYFDEGIFGNFGWGYPGPEPLGAPGIVKWSPQFEPVWRYQAVADYWLADCYALNVAAGQVWACPYVDFPVIDIREESTRIWPTEGVSGPRGLVVADDVVGIIGDYTDGSSLVTATLSELPRADRSSVLMPDGSKPPRSTLVCRGNVANLFVGNDWFVFDLAGTV